MLTLAERSGRLEMCYRFSVAKCAGVQVITLEACGATLFEN